LFQAGELAAECENKKRAVEDATLKT